MELDFNTSAYGYIQILHIKACFKFPFEIKFTFCSIQQQKYAKKKHLQLFFFRSVTHVITECAMKVLYEDIQMTVQCK